MQYIFQAHFGTSHQLLLKHTHLSNRQHLCPAEIVKVYRERKRPLYCSEDIIRLNIQNAAEVEKINFGRKNIQNSLGKGIDDCKTKIAVLEKN